MAVETHQEVQQSVRDPRSIDRKVTEALTRTNTTVIALGLMGVVVFMFPWAAHIFLPWGLVWWLSVALDRKRQVLPYALPQRANRLDYNNPKDGMQTGYKKAEGIVYLGNAVHKYLEVWESSSQSRQHHLMFGTTGAGKSEALSGIFSNFILLGAGCFFSDAKGTVEQVSKLWFLSRRFGRDVDVFSVFYGTGGSTVREGRRDRLTHKVNPVSFASTDQINNLFLSFLPKSSGDNQIFQDRAITMFTSLTPALVDLRDLHNEPLHIPKIRHYISTLANILDLALDPERKLTERSREILINYIKSLNVDWEAYERSRNGGGKYEIHAETYKQFGYAQNYFTRALSSLADTYGHIYNCEVPEVDYLDVVLNRRILIISLPSMEKAGAELNNLAKINLANLRGAIAVLTGDRVEGRREEILDNSLSQSEVPTGVILDEYGYQSTEGVGITLAQARSLGLSITIAGQDLSNIQMGSKEEAEQIFGNAVLIILYVRNVRELAEKVREQVGEADVAVESGLEKRPGVVTGYVSRREASIQRRYRLTGSDMMNLKTGEGYLVLGRRLGIVHYYPFAPLPERAPELVLGRYLPVSFEQVAFAEHVEVSKRLTAFVRARAEGRALPPGTEEDLTRLPRNLYKAIKAGGGEFSQEAWAAEVRRFLAPPQGPSLPADAPPRQDRAEEPMPARTATRLHGGSTRHAGAWPPLSTSDAGPDADAPVHEDAAPPPPAAGARNLAERIRAGARGAPITTPPGYDLPDEPSLPLPDVELDVETKIAAERDALVARGSLFDEDAADDEDSWNHESVDRLPERLPLPPFLPRDTIDDLPLNAELDDESEEDGLGDVDDPTVAEQLDRAGIDLDAVDRSYDPAVRSEQRAVNVMSRQRDLTAAIQESARYHPSDEAPPMPAPAAKVRATVDRILRTVERNRKIPGEAE